MAARAVVVIALTIFGCSEVAVAQTAWVGSFTGRITDTGDAALPGVRVTILGPGARAEAITDGHGRFEIEGLLQPAPAAYALRAELAGFETTTVDGLTADPGERAEIHVRMRVGCIEPDLIVALPIREAFAAADLVVLVRLDSFTHHGRVKLVDYCGPLTEFAATIREPIKPLNGDVSGAIRFVRMDRDRESWESDGEYLAFLQWHPDTVTYRLMGGAYLVPVVGGYVEWEQFALAGQPRMMPLSQALTTLRSLALSPKPVR